MTIEINDRLYKEFITWAEANGMDESGIAKYIENALRDKFTLDKYGDLNKKIHNSVKPSNEPINGPINEPIPEIGTDEQTSERINKDVEPENPSKRKTKVLVSK